MLEQLGLDRYDRKARLQPALWIVTPPLLLLAVWLPELRTLSGGGGVAVGTVVVMTFLISWTRHLGRNVQSKIDNDRGARPSTILLRHGEARLANLTRKRCHDVLRQNGFTIPTAQEQKVDPVSADQVLVACVDWMLESTRGDHLLLEANIEYGFRRNLLGVRPVALCVLLACLILDVAALLFRSSVTHTQMASGALLAGAYLAAALAWGVLVSRSFVERAGWDYAQRLCVLVAAQK